MCECVFITGCLVKNGSCKKYSGLLKLIFFLFSSHDFFLHLQELSPFAVIGICIAPVGSEDEDDEEEEEYS
jgi:hypothetical protein